MLWLNAAAFAGLALIALPLAIHLLVRQHARTLAFPSLRFVRETALSAFRRRMLDDALLFIVRAAVIAAAVAALAAPVIDSQTRRQEHATRVSRALVLIDATASDRADLAEGAFRVARFSRASIADALGDAVRWLNAQPASAREIVVAGALRVGAVFESDLQTVPPDIGIRFVQDAEPVNETTVRAQILAQRAGELVLLERRLRLDADSTHVLSETATRAPAGLVQVVAATADQPLADAALAAALREGIPWPRERTPAVLLWEGASVERNGPEIVRTPVPASAASAPSEVWEALSRTVDWPIEPFLLSHAQLDSWSRPPGPPAPDAPLQDEGDRRWLWGAALLLLGVEQWLRR